MKDYSLDFVNILGLLLEELGLNEDLRRNLTSSFCKMNKDNSFPHNLKGRHRCK